MNIDFNRLYALVTVPIVVALVLFFASWQNEEEHGNVVIGTERWKIVGVAATEETREAGLSERDSLCKRCALLFLFDQPARYSFWMKGMRFPIDIAWIREGRIVHIEREVPADFGGVMTPTDEADAVIETNAGELAGLREGDEVRY